mmetsp:Transcript_16260/g.40114  ORF Transcript_16260/g.40114 Transcript_16260/m.40114 type:complete len:241 (+) Transcript_16260:3763-4485(+)
MGAPPCRVFRFSSPLSSRSVFTDRVGLVFSFNFASNSTLASVGMSSAICADTRLGGAASAILPFFHGWLYFHRSRTPCIISISRIRSPSAEYTDVRSPDVVAIPSCRFCLRSAAASKPVSPGSGSSFFRLRFFSLSQNSLPAAAQPFRSGDSIVLVKFSVSVPLPRRWFHTPCSADWSPSSTARAVRICSSESPSSPARATAFRWKSCSSRRKSMLRAVGERGSRRARGPVYTFTGAFGL